MVFDKASAPDLQQAQPTRKQAMCLHMVDGRGCKGGDASFVKNQILKFLGYICMIVFGAALQAGEHFIFSPEQIESHLVSYNEQEKEDIAKDLTVVRSVCRVKEAPSKEKPFYLASAGGHGARLSQAGRHR